MIGMARTMKTNLFDQLVKVRPPVSLLEAPGVPGFRGDGGWEGSLWGESAEARFSLSPRGLPSLSAALKGGMGELAFLASLSLRVVSSNAIDIESA